MPQGDIIKSDPNLLNALETTYSMGCTDEEACLFAGISKRTLYGYIQQVPEFTERKEKLKLFPVLNARSTVTSKLKDDVNTAKWYLERKTKEFKPPDKNTNFTLNQLNLLTDSQIKDRLAHKLSKLLDQPQDDVVDAQVVEDNSNTDTS